MQGVKRSSTPLDVDDYYDAVDGPRIHRAWKKFKAVMPAVSCTSDMMSVSPEPPFPATSPTGTLSAAWTPDSMETNVSVDSSILRDQFSGNQECHLDIEPDLLTDEQMYEIVCDLEDEGVGSVV